MPSPASPTSSTSDFTPVKSTLQSLAGVAGAHHAAVPQRLAVADDEEFHARRRVVVHLVIHAHAGGKFLRAAVQVDVQDAFGVRAEAALEGLCRRWSADGRPRTCFCAARPSPAWRAARFSSSSQTVSAETIPAASTASERPSAKAKRDFMRRFCRGKFFASSSPAAKIFARLRA